MSGASGTTVPKPVETDRGRVAGPAIVRLKEYWDLIVWEPTGIQKYAQLTTVLEVRNVTDCSIMTEI